MTDSNPQSDPLAPLRKIHTSFARNASTTLSGMLRSFVEVKLEGIEELSDREFLLHADNPTFLCVLQAEPMAERFLLEINLSILFPIIDRLLGGGREPATPLRRPLTEIEQRLAGRVTAVLLDELRQSWKDVFDVRLTVERTECSPAEISPIAANAMLALIQFEVSLGNARGSLHLGIPAAVLDRGAGNGMHPRLADNNSAEVGSLVPVTAELSETKISAADLSKLEVGDIITTEQRSDEPIVIRVDGVANFLGKPEACNNRKAIRIERTLTSGGGKPSGPA